jgi:ribosomal protein S12 methylthiotransferase accessory factor
VVVLSSSLRSVPPGVTLARAREKARRLGITRVTDTTRLDRAGLPVYASIRPGAARGTLCVSGGKGLLPIEAEIGATMEAIELALAEPGASHVVPVRATARDVLDGRRRPEAILDLCPKMGTKIALDAAMDCVQARNVVTGGRALVPAELVFHPYRPHPRFRAIFGTSSNGLSSGNSLREATAHGLLELIERDVTSFQAVRDTSVPIDLDTVDGAARTVVGIVRDGGLDLYVRSAKNLFGIPYFVAIINDPEALAPHLLNGGFGCHPHRGIAFVRAVAEAAQSRLVFIHGSRDDLVDAHGRFGRWGRERKRAFVERVVARAALGKPVPFASVVDHAEAVPTVAGAEAFALRRLSALGMKKAYRVAFCRPADPLQVVKVIVPGLEHFTETLPRLGPRLSDHARAR